MNEKEIELSEGETAAAYCWSMLRAIEFNETEDTSLHAEMMQKARQIWPWLDNYADGYETFILNKSDNSDD